MLARDDEWPVKLFKMRGFARVHVTYDSMFDRMVVFLSRGAEDEPIRVELPEDYRSMPLSAFRNWVDAEVEKISGPSDFPTISLKPQAASIDG